MVAFESELSALRTTGADADKVIGGVKQLWNKASGTGAVDPVLATLSDNAGKLLSQALTDVGEKHGCMDHTFAIATLIGCVSLLYVAAGQAGGTAFIAVLSFAGFPASELRPTALLLNIVAAGYATWRLHRGSAIETKLLLPLALPSVVTVFIRGAHGSISC